MKVGRGFTQPPVPIPPLLSLPHWSSPVFTLCMKRSHVLVSFQLSWRLEGRRVLRVPCVLQAVTPADGEDGECLL